MESAAEGVVFFYSTHSYISVNARVAGNNQLDSESAFFSDEFHYSIELFAKLKPS